MEIIYFNRHSLPFIFFILITFLFFACNKPEESNLKPIIAEQKAIDINSVTVSLPYSEGVELVQANCITCHSLRYIEMQPDMPRKSWDKIIKKMVNIYGAPISDTITVNKIVDYLATIKGKK